MSDSLWTQADRHYRTIGAVSSHGIRPGGFRQLVGVLNDRLGERHLPAKTLDAVFEKFWPDLKSNIEGVIEAMPDTNQAPIRSTNEMLEEILRLVRRPRISLAVIAGAIITDLLKGYLTLHDDQVKKRSGYQGTLDHLHKMHNQIEYLIRKHAHKMEKTELVERFSTFRTRQKKRRTIHPASHLLMTFMTIFLSDSPLSRRDKTISMRSTLGCRKDL